MFSTILVSDTVVNWVDLLQAPNQSDVEYLGTVATHLVIQLETVGNEGILFIKFLAL